jgi:hypothetical protein
LSFAYFGSHICSGENKGLRELARAKLNTTPRNGDLLSASVRNRGRAVAFGVIKQGVRRATGKYGRYAATIVSRTERFCGNDAKSQQFPTFQLIASRFRRGD